MWTERQDSSAEQSHKAVPSVDRWGYNTNEFEHTVTVY